MKLLKVLVAVLVMAAMAVPVIAEDRLQLSGEMRVRSFHVDKDVHNQDDNTDTWANQRLRIAGKIAVAEGVSVTFRTDITEGTNWGDSSDFKDDLDYSIGPIRTNGYGHGRSGAQQQWDRAHLDLTKGIFHLRAGQQYIGSGGTWALDTQDSGLALDIVLTPVLIKVFGIVDKDNKVFDDVTNVTTDGADAFLYGAFADFKAGDNVKFKLILADYDDGEEKNVYLIGASATLDLSAVKVFGEIDFFDGDHNEALNQDAFGAQTMLDVSLAASDMVTVGAQFFYAMGDDTDTQYVLLGNGFNGWDPIYDVGTSLSNEEIVFGRPFDFTGMSAGVIGGRLYSNFKLNTALNVGASVSYLTEEEDAIIASDGYQVAAGMTYAILENTSFQVQLQYEEMDRQVVGVATNDDYDAFKAGTGIFVKF